MTITLVFMVCMINTYYQICISLDKYKTNKKTIIPLTQRNGRSNWWCVQLLVTNAGWRHTRRNAVVQHRTAVLVVVVVVVIGNHHSRWDNGCRRSKGTAGHADYAVRVMVVVITGSRWIDAIVGAQLGQQLVLVLDAPLAGPQLRKLRDSPRVIVIWF